MLTPDPYTSFVLGVLAYGCFWVGLGMLVAGLVLP
jgi:hypothetical protein